MSFSQNLKFLMELNGISNYRLSHLLGCSQTTVGNWAKDISLPYPKDRPKIAKLFGVTVDELMGDTIPETAKPVIEKPKKTLRSPEVTEHFVKFPVLGEVAAGYDHIGFEDWTGDTIEIPDSYLKGRDREDFFVLRVVGDSMYPMYHHGDYVLVQRAETLSRSGEVGVVLYNDETVTLKRVEYVMGEDWMRLVPVNPQVPPETIKGEKLEHCRILGVPKLMIRELGD